MIALNARPILDARLRGFKPDEMVVVSLVGPVDVANHVVRAVSAETYDWRWVRGLEICVYVGDGLDWLGTVKAIALQRPAYLILWNSVSRWGANVYCIPTPEDITKPPHRWTYELDYLAWMDFQNIDFVEGRTYGRTPEGMPYAVSP
jgi:hypothetical protein